MPIIGEIRKARQAGKTGSSRYVWHACEVCGRERWVQIKNGQPRNKFCVRCPQLGNPSWLGKVREFSSNWKGGRTTDTEGYIHIRLSKSDFYFPMAVKQGYVKEHRLVMAKSLGRCLQPWEIVHHKNHIRDDNRIENLQIELVNGHNQLSILENEIKKLEERVILLEAENTLLKAVMKGNSEPQHDNPWYDEGSITTPADVTVTGSIYPDTRHGELR